MSKNSQSRSGRVVVYVTIRNTSRLLLLHGAGSASSRGCPHGTWPTPQSWIPALSTGGAPAAASRRRTVFQRTARAAWSSSWWPALAQVSYEISALPGFGVPSPHHGSGVGLGLGKSWCRHHRKVHPSLGVAALTNVSAGDFTAHVDAWPVSVTAVENMGFGERLSVKVPAFALPGTHTLRVCWQEACAERTFELGSMALNRGGQGSQLMDVRPASDPSSPDGERLFAEAATGTMQRS